MPLPLVLVWTCAAILSLAWPATVAAVPVENKDFKIVFLHTNDMHARFEQTDRNSSRCHKQQEEAGQCYGGFARVAHAVRQAKAKAQAGEGPPVLFLNAGDTYQGTVWYTVHKWRIAAAFINLLQPDAISLGNHEFDDDIAGLVPFLQNVTCPVVAANVDTSREPSLAATPLKKSVVLEVKGVKIGIVGYLTPDTKNMSQIGLVEITDEVVAITQEMQRLKKTGVNILVALGHSGYDVDLRIAREVPDVDVVIGGHTNTFLYNGTQPDSEVPDGLYPTVVKQPSGRLVPVVQAYAYTKYLGHLTMEFDKNGEAKLFVGNPILLDNKVAQDPVVLQEVEKWREEVSNITKQKVGSTKVFLEGSTKQCRVQECNLGNLIADAMVFYHARTYRGPGWTDAPIAIQHGGGIRNSIDALHGEVTMEDLMGVLPFGNDMYILSMKGSEVMQMLEWSVYRHDPSRTINSGAFMQYSGLKVTYDMRKPAGHRVTTAVARCGDCRVPTYSPINPNQHYKLIVTQFIANGGDGYEVFKRKNITQYDYSDLDVVVDYFKHKSPVYPGIEGRIIFNPSLEEVVEYITNTTTTESPVKDTNGSASIFATATSMLILCAFVTIVCK